MRYLAMLAMLMFAGLANAQGFIDEPTCYSWNGGHKSAGSFSKCQPWVVAAAPTPPPPVVVPAPVMQAAPISCAPPPLPIQQKKRKPRPVLKCNP